MTIWQDTSNDNMLSNDSRAVQSLDIIEGGDCKMEAVLLAWAECSRIDIE